MMKVLSLLLSIALIGAVGCERERDRGEKSGKTNDVRPGGGMNGTERDLDESPSGRENLDGGSATQPSGGRSSEDFSGGGLGGRSRDDLSGGRSSTEDQSSTEEDQNSTEDQAIGGGTETQPSGTGGMSDR